LFFDFSTLPLVDFLPVCLMLIGCGKFNKNIHVILWLSEQFSGLQAAFRPIVSAIDGYMKAGTSSLKGVSVGTFRICFFVEASKKFEFIFLRKKAS
jgi:hypothetical protein